MRIYKGVIVDIKGMGTIQKGMAQMTKLSESTVLYRVLLALFKQESYRQDSCQGN